MSKSLPATGVIAVAIAALSPSLALAQTATAVQICECLVTDLSSDGQAATGLLNGAYETFYWSAQGGLQALGRATLPVIGTMSGLPAISGDGKKVAATVLDDTGSYATQGAWTATKGWQMLSKTLPPDGGIMDTEDSSVYGMSRDGKIVTGLYWRPNQSGGSAHGSVWQAKVGMTGLPTAGGSARIDDANKDGSVLAGWEEDPVNGSRLPAVWVNGERTLLDLNYGEAEAVNGDGDILVGQAPDPETGIGAAARWKWDGKKWETKILGILPNSDWGGMAYANALSDDGKLVGGLARTTFTPATSGFLWTKATGLVLAADFLKTYGYSARNYNLTNVIAITPKGDKLVIVEVMKRSPYTMRSMLITLPPAALAP
ncbi:MAG TPA: hypothetical protein VLA61_08950 [Ideonella sp.]|uniref:hypothetical protein n=1 Tax=Ideonella sp. TaxID=1929293 RepID=UPI002BE01EDC|nr:hypothetical protein [Ideonella sp.]HSI48382.1 hypothetical protein [Ideonella sp.]